MLSPLLRKKLNKLFIDIESPEGHLNINEFEGLMYAIAITPEIIQPSE